MHWVSGVFKLRPRIQSFVSVYLTSRPYIPRTCPGGLSYRDDKQCSYRPRAKQASSVRPPKQSGSFVDCRSGETRCQGLFLPHVPLQTHPDRCSLSVEVSQGKPIITDISCVYRGDPSVDLRSSCFVALKLRKIHLREIQNSFARGGRPVEASTSTSGGGIGSKK